MSEVLITVGAVLYWTFAVFLYTFMTYEREGAPRMRIAYAMGWPFVFFFGLPLVVFRVFVKTGKEIRTGLRNRKLLKEFEAWHRANKE